MQELGLKNPIMILSHHNCELYCCQLDGYKQNAAALLARMNIIERELSNKPVNAKFRIWYNMDENELDQSILKSIAESIFRLQSHIHKIAFIGLHGISKWRFEKILKQMLGKQPMPRAYFLDAEEAKGWLI